MTGFLMSAWVRRGLGSDLGVLLCGAVLPLAFAPFDQQWLAFLCPAFFLGATRGVKPARGFWRGVLFGLGLFGIGSSWVYVSIHDFGHVGVPLSVFLTALLVAYLSLFPALLGWAMSRFWAGPGKPSLGLVALVVFPAGWALSEWLRGWFLTGFPWLLLGTSQVGTALDGFAPLLGVYGVSWIVATGAGSVYWLSMAESWRSRSLIIMLALAFWGFATVLSSIEWARPAGEPLKVSLIQGNIPQDIKWLPGMRAPTVELYTELTQAHWDSDIIVWPESAFPGFYRENDSALAVLADEAAKHDTALLLGILYQDPLSARYYNSVVLLGPERQFYHKRHLVPFTEYLPLKAVLGGLVDFMQVPMSDFSAGRPDQVPLSASTALVAASICYEDAFGEELISMLPEATLLVNVSNDAWFGRSIAPFQHMQIARMRARETARPLLRATNTGISAIVDHRGRVIATSPQFTVDVLTAVVQPMQGATPYVRTGNAVVVLVCLLLATAGGLRCIRRRRPWGRSST